MQSHQPHRRIWRWISHILDYGPIVLTVFAAFFASYRASQSGVKIEELLQLVLIVLSLLASTQLIDRAKFLRNLDSKVDTILHDTAAAHTLDTLFLKRAPVLDDRIRQAKTIAHNGITLVGTSNTLLGLFAERLAEDCTIRLMMTDPETAALDVAAQRFLKHQDRERLKRESAHALDNFSSLYTSAQPGLQMGLLAAVPSYSIWLFDADTVNAELWVGLYSYRDVLEPWLHLLPHRDGAMFAFFQRQFETMWQASTPLERAPQKQP